MPDFLRDNCDEIKEIVVKTKGTPTQKLLAILAAAGIDDASELAEMLDVTERYVRKARNQSSGPIVPAEPEFRNQSSEIGTRVPEKRNQSSAEKKVSPRTPLQRNNHLEQSVQQAAARDDGRTDDVAECKAAFNGSTEAMLAMVESAMGGHCRPNAAQWLANLTRINGQQAVAQAFQKFLTAKAEGLIIARPLPWFDKTARTCKAEAPKTSAVADYPLAAITVDMKRNMKPAPGSARMPEAARA